MSELSITTRPGPIGAWLSPGCYVGWALRPKTQNGRRNPSMPLSMLLVEDSVRKEDRVRELVARILPDAEFDIHTARSATEAGSRLKKHRYDLLVLDIQLPMRDMENPKADGGLVVLRALKERKEYNRPTYVVGLSAFPELVTQFEADFSEEMWHLIYYREDSDDWTLKLSRLLIHLADSVRPAPDGSYEYDIAIITALHKVELEAVLALRVDWTRKDFDGDPTVYHFGDLVGPSRRLRAVTAAATEVGMPTASALAMKMVMKFKPRYLALVGIAAGVKGHFGDILVASQVWDYGSGRLSTDGHSKSAFEPAPSPIPMAPFLHSRFEAFGLDASPLRRIQSNWSGTESRGGPLEAKLGPI